jgi:hypothetical protein
MGFRGRPHPRQGDDTGARKRTFPTAMPHGQRLAFEVTVKIAKGIPARRI